MSTTAQMPPTTHALPHDERARLMRSARKLEAVLGETPLLVDAPPSPSHRNGHARSMSTLPADGPPMGRLYALARSGSLRRTASATQSRPRPHPLSHAVAAAAAPRPLLVISLPPTDAGATAADAPRSAGSPSPLTPSSANIPLFPAADADADVDEDAARRRKLAKLTRTLGENVPPALVFPARRRASTLGVPESIRERLRAPAPALVHAPESTPERAGRASSDTLAFASSRTHLLPRAGTTDTAAAMTHRREQGWSGEWGGAVQSMDDVVRALRGLRGK
ncbi:hypothetical protein GGX14DRAFT_677285 [Mycena pura]|uniref:Uncharacterized protein n=1 Tax=Mycena pura TaxID=153505 RepID=A0AAD6UUI7_9AGAR|nr:hypothetical protein GGX14DRAFT_677285 [Mycena pura]